VVIVINSRLKASQDVLSLVSREKAFAHLQGRSLLAINGVITYNPYKWPYKWVPGRITLFLDAPITPFMTGWQVAAHLVHNDNCNYYPQTFVGQLQDYLMNELTCLLRF